MKYSKWLLITFYIISINFNTSAVASSTYTKSKFEVRIAIVDIQAILENSIAIQSIRKLIDKFSQEIQQDMSKKDTEFKKLEEELIKKRESLSEQTFDKEINKFHKKVSEAQKEMQGKKTRLEHAHAEAMGKVHEATINIISNLAQKHNLNLVIPSTQILYAKNNLNMTEEVTNQLNSKLKFVKVNY